MGERAADHLALVESDPTHVGVSLYVVSTTPSRSLAAPAVTECSTLPMVSTRVLVGVSTVARSCVPGRHAIFLRVGWPPNSECSSRGPRLCGYPMISSWVSEPLSDEGVVSVVPAAVRPSSVSLPLPCVPTC